MKQVGFWRGGDYEYGGIFWADICETAKNPLEGYHSRVENIKKITINDKTSITYCDCLYNNQYLVIDNKMSFACKLNEESNQSLYL